MNSDEVGYKIFKLYRFNSFGKLILKIDYVIYGNKIIYQNVFVRK
jgi:hypothetical protein